MTNTNNSLELLVKLGIDKSNKTDLQTQVDELGKKLNGLQVDIKIDPKAISALEKISTMDFSKLTDNAKKATDQVSDLAVKSAKEAKEAMESAFGSMGRNFPKSAEKGFQTIEQIKKSLSGLGSNIKLDFDVVNGKQKLDKIVASFEKDGITKTIHFKQAIVSDNGNDSPLWMPDKIKEVDKNLSIAAKSVDELVSKMNKLQTEGKLTNDQFEHLTNSIKNIDKNGGMAGLNHQLDQYVINNKRATEAIQAQEKAQKEQLAEIKRQEEVQRQIIENEIKRKNLILDIERAMKSQSKTLNNDAAKKLIEETKLLDTTSKNFGTSLKQNQSALKELKTNATEATRSNIGLVEALQTAFTKFPIWMAASTAFFGTIRTAKEFGSIILDIDTKMTNLAKVMSDDTDFEGVFDRATQSAERFGQSISSALDAYAEFARQGYKEEELGILADAGLVASNVGEITAQKASEYMTATLIQWRMDAKEAMGIISSWNEISNNYATTVEKLAQGHARAASVAKIMGLEFNQVNAIIGSITASTKQSGNEIGNFLKSVLPRLVGKPAQDALGSLGISLTDSDGNLRDIIQVYTEVAERVKDISESERISVIEGLAGKYHISRMSALLTDLGEADSLYRNMYESSVNSAGSAERENEKFMKSLQARINLARVEVEKLAISMGDAFLTEGMIQGIQLFGDFLGVITKFVDRFGALPALMGTTGVAIYLLSTGFRNLSTSVGSSVVSLLGFRGATTATATASSLASGAVRGLSVAFKGLLASTGVGLALVAVGVGIEALMGKLEKQRQLQEEIRQENERLVQSYTSNRESIISLSEEYANLETAMENGKPDNETQEKYYDVQNRLAELMPDLVKGEDSYGNKILSNSSIVESKIKLLEKQIEVEERLQKIQQDAEDAEMLRENKRLAKDKSEKAEIQLDYIARKANNGMGNQIYDYQGEIKNLQDMEKAIAYFEEQRVLYAEKGQKGISEKMGRISADLQKNVETYARLTSEADSAQTYLTKKAIENAEKQIAANKELSDSTKELATEMVNEFSVMADSSKDAGVFAEVFSSQNMQSIFSGASDAISKFTNSSEKDFINQKAVFEDYAATLKEAMLSKAVDASGNKLEENTLNALSDAYDSYISKLILREAKVREVMETEGISREEVILSIKTNGEFEDSIEGLTDSLDDYLDKLLEKSSVEEQIAGVSQKQIDAIDDLIFMYNTLSSQTSLTADQSLALKDAQEKLMAIYPQLNKNGEFRIDSIVAERNAQDILLKAVKASKEGQLTLEEDATVGHLLETNSRISIINAEIEATQKLANAYASVYDSVVNAAKNGDESAAKLLMRISVPTAKYQTAQAELATLEKTRSGYVSNLSGVIDNLESSTSKSSKSTKDANKSTKDSIYITDQYKLALEAVNLEIEKQQRLRSNMTEFSKQYRDSLQKEVDLEKQKSKLMQDQANALEKQIKSGKIAQTGNISSSSTTSTQKLSGWGGNVTSQFGMRTDPFTGKKTTHAGVDLGGSKGTRLDANISGKVVYAGNSGNGFGNYVTIQAEDGMKHIYAHLDKVVATLGQTITAGMQVGTIGSSGRSTGSHLHYEVRNSNNKAIDPNEYMQSAKAGTVTSKAIASGVSNAQQAIDQAKSDLTSLQGQILASQETIAKLELEIIGSQLSEFDNTRKQFQHTLDYENAKQDAISQTGKEYRASIDKQITAMNGQQSANQAELKFLDSLIANGKLSAVTMTEMKERVKALKVEMLQLGTAIENANFEKITSRMKAFDETNDDLQFLIDLTGEYMNTFTEGSEDYNKAANEQIATMQKLQRSYRTQIEEHKKDLATKKLGVQETKDLKEKIEDLTLAYYSLGNGIKSTTESLAEANKRMQNEVADKLISVWKDYYGELKNAQMKALDAIMKAEDKRHKQASDNLSKELDAYKKIIQAKLDMLDKEESERDYNKEIDALEKDRLDILNKINLLSLDDSFEARKEAANLTEKLNATEEQIAEKRHDREIELRKQNLNDLLDKKEEEVKQRQELEDQRYEHEKELIDKQKQDWEQYYNNLLNDERKFAKLREDIVAGNTEAIKAEFGEILDYFKETMPYLEIELDGTMKTIGDSIRQNMIDNLETALNLMNQLGKNTTTPSISNGQFQSDKNNANVTPPKASSPSTPSTGDSKATGIGEITIEKPINLWKRVGDKLVHDNGRVLQPGDKFRVYGRDDKFGGQYNVGGGNWVTDMPGYIKYKKFDTGGYTKNGEGFAMLHEKEIVLNKDDTKNFLKGIDILRTLDNLINPLRMPSVKPPQLAGVGEGGDLVINFNVDKMNATQSEADSFSKRIGDNLKRLKGLK